MRYMLPGMLALVLVPACGSGTGSRPTGQELEVTWSVVDNLAAGGPQGSLRLTNHSTHRLPAEGWEIYFNFARQVRSDQQSPLQVQHVNGDLYRLAPRSDFAGLEPGQSVELHCTTSAPVLNYSEGPAGFYLVMAGGTPEVVPASAGPIPVEQWRRGPDDQLPPATPAHRYRRDESLTVLPAPELPPIIPTPVAAQLRPGSWTLNSSTRVSHGPGLGMEAQLLVRSLEPLLGSRLTWTEEESAVPTADLIRLELAPVQVGGRTPGGEAYRLQIDPRRGVLIQGTDAAGVFYGTQSLLALLPVQVWASPADSIPVPAWAVEDAPRFRYRGQHLDVGRNFHSQESVEKLLDLMAFYKLNRFHFHLTDDEGWRLEIPGLPELVEVGSRRGHTLTETDHLVPSFGSGPFPDRMPGSGHYSREQFIALLRHAQARHIQVIPEIDVPGHARAAIRAMEARRQRLNRQGDTEGAVRYLLHEPEDRSAYQSVQGWTDNVINVCQDSTYRFLEKVVDEVQAMYREAGAPLEMIHTGGDEVPEGVWAGSPACRQVMQQHGMREPRELTGYFLDRLAGILDQRGLRLGGWEEVALTGGTHDALNRKQVNPRFVNRRFVAWAWNSVWGWGGEDFGYRLANAGYDVVLAAASNLYFDLADSKEPDEPGYYWAGFVDTRKPWEFIPLDLFRGGETDRMGRPMDPARYREAVRLSPEGLNRILGLQAQLWSENAKSPELLEYLLCPKLIAFSERAWAASPAWAEAADPEVRRRLRQQSWNVFANTLGQRELKRLDSFGGGWLYRIPPPGALVEDGLLKANVEFPGLVIHYTLDGTDPTISSPRYDGPVKLQGTARLAAFTASGRRSRVVAVE